MNIIKREPDAGNEPFAVYSARKNELAAVKHEEHSVNWETQVNCPFCVTCSKFIGKLESQISINT
jgi:hypothetical protein